MVNVAPLSDVPPPGAGFVAVTITEFGVVMSDWRICTESWPVLAFRVVERGEPFQLTTVVPLESETNPVPVTAKVKPSLPAVMTEGNRPLTVGVALNLGVFPPPQLP